MTAVLELLSYLVGLAQGIYSLVSGLNSSASRELTPYATEGHAAVAAMAAQTAALNSIAAKTAIQDPTNGLVAINTNISAVPTSVNAHTDAQIALLYGSGGLPPAGVVWGPNWAAFDPDQSGVSGFADPAATGVWLYPLTVTGPSMGHVMKRGFAFTSVAFGGGGMLAREDPHFLVDLVSALVPSWTLYDSPAADWSLILPTDTPATWLTRSMPDWHWASGAYPYQVRGWHLTAGVQDGPVWTFTTTAQEWASATSVSTQAPVWPGLAGVTLGTPVALVDQLDVAGPLAGVLIDTTVAPHGRTVYPVGAVNVYYQWGQIVFEQDNGECEPFQWLATGQGMYLPRQMNVAASAHLRVLGTPTGTVTPFTIP